MNLSDETNFPNKRQDYSLFTDKLFLRSFENMKESTTKSTYYLIFSQFFTIKRRNNMSIETIKQQWKCLDDLFVLKNVSNSFPGELLELCSCV